MTLEDLGYRKCGPLFSYFHGAFASYLMLEKLQFSFTENALGKKKTTSGRSTIPSNVLIVFLISQWFSQRSMIES